MEAIDPIVIDTNILNQRIDLAKEVTEDDFNQSDEECFEDANDYSSGISNPPDLESSLEEVVMLLAMALNNRFNEAMDLCDKWAHESLYHALGKGCLSFLKGCLTLERIEITKAMEALKNCIDICYRKKRSSVTRVVWRPNYNHYTDEEIHAELVYAEALLMTALLTFLEDQNLINLVKGAFRVRNCYQSYKECMYILDTRTQWQSENIRKHFESGCRMGIGTFQLMISHMPSKVLKLLEFVGFSGDRAQGFTQLEQSTQLTEGLRCPLAALIMLCYQCYVEHIFGLGQGDLECVQKLLDFSLNIYPNSAFFLLFLGRLEQLRGNVNEAIENYNKCIGIQDEWKQFHNICYWELLWCYSVQCDWHNSAKYADILRRQCKWSPATYNYQYATFLYMIMTEQNHYELKDEINEILRTVPKLKIRYAGKTIPAEKFAITQTEKYFSQNETFLLPALEFLYIWNIFVAIGNSPKLLNPILERVEKGLDIHKDDKHVENKSLDNYALLMLLKGMCMRSLGFPLQAQQCFKEVLECENMIKIDTYLAPHSAMELGLTHLSMDELSEARLWLNKARHDYTGYLLETIVHFRVHCAMRTIKSKLQLTISSSLESTPVSTPNTDSEINTSSINSRISSLFMEFSKKISIVSLNATNPPQSRGKEYEEFLDGYQIKL